MDAPGHRFRHLRELGRGGMGTVDLVLDSKRGEEVARKRIKVRSPDWEIRFKREFRVAERLRHENLVTLFELGRDDEGLFYTMEVVPGKDVLSAYRETAVADAPALDVRGHARPRPSWAGETEADSEPLPSLGAVPAGPSSAGRLRVGPAPFIDLPRLHALVAQLVDAFAYLHGQGVVHRDVKPANVRVTPSGIVKVLDFGILAEVGIPVGALDADAVPGTLGYIAPELLLRAEEPSPASDLYSLGALLFYMISGRPVFTGSAHEIREQHLRALPPRLSQLARDVPPALDEVCHALLSKTPAARPTLDALARAVLPAVGATPRALRVATDTTLVGQERLRSSLAQHLAPVAAGSFAAILLVGPTGSGKTSLANELARLAEARGMRVLSGRGRPEERIPYNAIDAAMDALALLLRSSALGEQKATTDPIRRAASLAFPVLRAVGEEAPARDLRRSELFSAVVALLRLAGAREGGVVLAIDDLQCADVDSVAFLRALVEEAPAHVLVVATMRTDVAECSASLLLDEDVGFETHQVSPVDDDAVREIVRRAAARAGHVVLAEPLERAAKMSAGRPYLAEVLGRAIARAHGAASIVDPSSALGDLVSAASPPQRRLLAILLAEDDWVDVDEITAVLAMSVGAVERTLVDLVRDGLVRRMADARRSRVALFHDTVGVAVRAAVAPELLVETHAKLAQHLETLGGGGHRLVHHWLAAGEPLRAVPHARAAAARAQEQRAYGLAADMFGFLLAHTEDPVAPLLRMRGDALLRSARYAEAAECFRRLAAIETGDGLRDVLMYEAYALLSAGDVRGGHSRLDDLLAEDGRPPRRAGLVRRAATALAFVVGPRKRRVPEVTPARREVPSASADDEKRADRDVMLATLVAYFDPLAGIGLYRERRARFAREGRTIHAAWCDYSLAYLASFTDGKRRPCKLSARYRQRGDARVAGAEPAHPFVRALPHLLDCVDAERLGRWATGIAAAEEALRIVAEGGLEGTFEHLFALVHRTQIDMYAQDVRGFARGLGRRRAASRDRLDAAMGSHVHNAEFVHAYFAGSFDVAAAHARRLQTGGHEGPWTLQQITFTLATSLLDVYTSDCREARRRVQRAFREGRMARLLDNMYTGHFAGVAALVEVSALLSGDAGASAVRIRRLARACEKAPPLRHTAGIRALAYLEDHEGASEAAIATLLRAEREAMVYGQRIDAAIARHQRGLRLAGAEGARLRAEARQLVAAAGASERLLDEDATRR